MSRQIESAALTNTPTRIPRDVTLIRPMTGLSLPDFGELVRYRDLLWMLVLRDLKVRYKQTFFGAAWALLQPLLTMAAFSLFFGKLARLRSGRAARARGPRSAAARGAAACADRRRRRRVASALAVSAAAIPVGDGLAGREPHALLAADVVVDGLEVLDPVRHPVAIAMTRRFCAPSA